MFETLSRHYRKGQARQGPQAGVSEARSGQLTVPEIPGIDVAGGLRRVAGNRKLYLDLLGMYVKEQQRAAEDVREALRNKDTAIAERIAHTLKGVSGNIGAVEVQEAAGEVETAIRKGRTEGETEEILERLCLILEATMARISAAVAGSAEGSDHSET
jgi:HPt (histidine-containing phosphotransfer) domain-containing protein